MHLYVIDLLLLQNQGRASQQDLDRTMAVPSLYGALQLLSKSLYSWGLPNHSSLVMSHLLVFCQQGRKIVSH